MKLFSLNSRYSSLFGFKLPIKELGGDSSDMWVPCVPNFNRWSWKINEKLSNFKQSKICHIYGTVTFIEKTNADLSLELFKIPTSHQAKIEIRTNSQQIHV